MKYALVTGGTKGIGRATVEKLLMQGYFVLINFAHDKAAADNMAHELESKGQKNYKFIQADLSKVENVEAFVCEIENVASSIDALVLNVGVTDYASFGTVTTEIWNQIMDTNLTVPFFMIQRMKDMMAYEGNITIISSVMGNYPHGRSIPYGVSKIGAIYLAQLLVKEFSEKRVRVNAVSPGFTETDMQKEKTPAHRERITNKLALHRFAAPEEIADMVCAVISNTYINGANIEVDGGYSYF